MKKIQKYLNNSNYCEKPEDFYLNRLGAEAFGSIVYIFPFLFVYFQQ
jgi:hypothetical protein